MSLIETSQELTSQSPNKKRILIPLFNRATYARVSVLISELEKSEELQPVLLLSGSLCEEAYGNAQEYIKKDHTKCEVHAHRLQVHGESDLQSTQAQAEILSVVSRVVAEVKPELVIVIGDRFETLPAAMAASMQHVPLAHIQGGEVTGNIDEKVRHAVTKLADYHFTSTKLAKSYIECMGEIRGRIYHVGCPSFDLIRQAKIKRRRPREKYLIGMIHPDTEDQGNFAKGVELLVERAFNFAAHEGYRVYWYYPNNDPGTNTVSRVLDEWISREPVFFLKAPNKEPVEFLYHLAGCRFAFGNSSALIREASFLGVPTINVGARQSIRERSWNVVDCDFVGYQLDNAFKKYDSLLKRRNGYERSFLYGNGFTARRISRVLHTFERFTLKPCLQYPFLYQYKGEHFGEHRFHTHKKRPRSRRAEWNEGPKVQAVSTSP